MMIIEWPCHFDAFRISLEEAMRSAPCNIALVRGPLPAKIEKVLVAIRGGPNAELSLRLSLSIAQMGQAKVTSLHFVPTTRDQLNDAPYRNLAQVLSQMPDVILEEVHTDNPAGTILKSARQFDLVVMGATAKASDDHLPIGPIARRVLDENHGGVVIVRSENLTSETMVVEQAGLTAISVLVDKWFAENTYHANEFSELEKQLELKQVHKITISLALPALNEEKTVGDVISTLKTALMDEVPLIDEMVLIDSNSQDRTREIAADLGIPVYIHQEILPRLGSRSGKGEALWKSLLVTRGDIVIWVDTDIVNIHPRFIYGLLGPLLLQSNVMLVKGFYRRPLRVDNKLQAGGGGRVTELTARPLINLFFPELSGIIQPLSGEYGGRRSALERLPFFSGYGVEIGLLIDFLDYFGLSSIAQVDLLERIHHNQPLEALSKMSFSIIQAVSRKLERRFERNILEEVNKTMKLIRHEPGRFFLDVEEIRERERPPMIEIPEYCELHPR
jgi:glucosyl-3-phosphoglycerate synthase